MDVSVRRRSTTQQSWSVARVAGAYPLFVRSTSSNNDDSRSPAHRTCRMRPYLSRPAPRWQGGRVGQRPVRLYNSCYDVDVSSSLAEVARRADDLVARGVPSWSVRCGKRCGRADPGADRCRDRAQPTRGFPPSPFPWHVTCGPSVAQARTRDQACGGRRRWQQRPCLRIIATGEDREGSDIDLLFTMGRPLSLMQLGALELSVSEIVDPRSTWCPTPCSVPSFGTCSHRGVPL
jgi:hypothetical protein